MLAYELLLNDLVPLYMTDNAMLALSLMEEYKVTHLPVVEAGVFKGLLSESDIYSYNRFEDVIANQPIVLNNITVTKDQHIFDVIEIIHKNSLSLLPVIDDDGIYLGSIFLTDVISKLSEITGINNPGGIIVLEMNIHDYSLSEIAQIVESNNIKIINSYVSSFNDSTKIEVTLKLNSVDIEALIQTFNRYNYQIKASYTDVDLNDNISDRYNSLMNYLNI